MARRITAEQLNSYSKQQLETYIYRTAKKANLDLRALEKAGADAGSQAYKKVRALSFDGEIVRTNKQGQIYFKGSYHDKTRGQLLHIASEIATFKASKTHTPAGVERAYHKAYKTYVNKRAAEIAGEEEGTISPSRAGVLKAKRQLESQVDKNWFNTQWGTFSKEMYSKAKMMSETVAQLMEQGYSARQIAISVNKIGEEHSLDEYKQAMRRSYTGYEDGGLISRPAYRGERNPFLED